MAKTWNAKAYAAASATSPLASTTIPRREPTEHDVQIEILFCGICHSDLHYGAQRVEQRHAHRLPVRARARDRRARDEGRLGGDQVQGRRPRRRRLPGRFRRHLPASARPASSSSARTDAHLQLAGQAPRRRHLRRLLRQHRRGRALRPARPGEPQPRRRRAAALRRDHDLLAAAPLGRRPRARRSAWSASAGSATWA